MDSGRVNSRRPGPPDKFTERHIATDTHHTTFNETSRAPSTSPYSTVPTPPTLNWLGFMQRSENFIGLNFFFAHCCEIAFTRGAAARSAVHDCRMSSDPLRAAT
eukprot:726469-Prymnesium_polylepis.1